ncbi:MerR family transcriptional regulator [Companilactobacillus allii]|uniref:HTH merR-type domain-containing protein n=1 Tax=Companilactobacillus allii TaxID=1847728 RepID=A0A1P8Q310_9LACO|nr:MerR family transcriptional regulator [Companilactobacillus allii]APX72221.1 hypothetical protein BTM29_06455 [Companilactobacillus allii]USQ69314.1 MerR family transcriptional regulator [Companilactobacillus allii]
MQIKEISDRLDIRPETIRYWEKVGLVSPSSRTKSGYRDYDETNVEWIQYVKCLRVIGVPIENIKKYNELFLIGDSTINERKNIIIDQRQHLIDQIKEFESALELADNKIKNYEKMILPVERELKNKSNIK